MGRERTRHINIMLNLQRNILQSNIIIHDRLYMYVLNISIYIYVSDNMY
jgi:hypothetical protein